MVIKHYFDGDFNINPMKLNDNKSLEMQGCSQQIWKPRALPICTAWFYNEAFYFNVTHYIPRWYNQSYEKKKKLSSQNLPTCPKYQDFRSCKTSLEITFNELLKMFFIG